MAKRRIKFKLGEIKISGVELEIEDEREAATSALATLQSQLGAAIQPAVGKALLGSGAVIDVPVADNSNNGTAQAQPRKRRRLTKPSGSGKSAEVAEAIELIHDPDRFGNPLESWTTAEKGMWLLWVVEQATGQKQLTIGEIVNTYNKHFSHFKTIVTSNLTRDLGFQRKKTPPPVGVDTNKSPQVWYLHENGKTMIEQLAKNPK